MTEIGFNHPHNNQQALPATSFPAGFTVHSVSDRVCVAITTRHAEVEEQPITKQANVGATGQF